MDAVVTDASGKVKRGTRAERMAVQTALVDSLAPKLARSPILRSLLESYSRAVNDPANELVHLYEIRDALAKHYGGEQNARAALGISSSEWSRLGKLANVEPLEQGRHRGQHPSGRRQAEVGELQEARTIVLRWIEAFASTV